MANKEPKLTADTITNEQIHLIRKAMLGMPRKNSYHRAILADCGPALDGDKTCRESVAHAYNKMDAATAGLVQCGNCDVGFRRVNGIHIASQRLGMIPDTPCDRVFAICDKSPEAPLARSWLAYVDGNPLRKQKGEVRRYASASTAYRAARTAAPKRWHP